MVFIVSNIHFNPKKLAKLGTLLLVIFLVLCYVFLGPRGGLDHKELNVSADFQSSAKYNIQLSYISAVLLLSNGMVLTGGKNLENRLVTKKPRH